MDLCFSDYDYQLIIGAITPVNAEQKLSKRIAKYQRCNRIDITDEIATNYTFMTRVSDEMWSKLVLAYEQQLARSAKYMLINGDLYDKQKIDRLLDR